MSKVAIQGNASGTGTFTIAAPNSNTDRTLTLPDEAGTVLTSASDIPAANITGTLPASVGKPLLLSTSVSSGTTIEIPVGYQSYEIIGQNIVVGTDSDEVSLRFSTSDFSSDTDLESAFRYVRIENADAGGQADDNEVRIATNMGNDATDNCCFKLFVDNLTTNNTKGYGGFGRSMYGHGGDQHSYAYVIGFRSQSTGVFKYMQISASTGTLSGTILVYGVGS